MSLNRVTHTNRAIQILRNRLPQALRKLSTETKVHSKKKIDYVIVGGGMIGANVAIRASLNGQRVCVVTTKENHKGSRGGNSAMVHPSLLGRSLAEAYPIGSVASMVSNSAKGFINRKKAGDYAPFTLNLKPDLRSLSFAANYIAFDKLPPKVKKDITKLNYETALASKAWYQMLERVTGTPLLYGKARVNITTEPYTQAAKDLAATLKFNADVPSQELAKEKLEHSLGLELAPQIHAVEYKDDATLDLDAFDKVLHKTVTQAGGTFEQDTVIGVEKTHSNITGVHTESGQFISGDKYTFAMGALAGNLASSLGIESDFIPLCATGTLVIFKAKKGSPIKMGDYNSFTLEKNWVFASFQPHPDGQLRLRATSFFNLGSTSVEAQSRQIHYITTLLERFIPDFNKHFEAEEVSVCAPGRPVLGSTLPCILKPFKNAVYANGAHMVGVTMGGDLAQSIEQLHSGTLDPALVKFYSEHSKFSLKTFLGKYPAHLDELSKVKPLERLQPPHTQYVAVLGGANGAFGKAIVSTLTQSGLFKEVKGISGKNKEELGKFIVKHPGCTVIVATHGELVTGKTGAGDDTLDLLQEPRVGQVITVSAGISETNKQKWNSSLSVTEKPFAHVPSVAMSMTLLQKAYSSALAQFEGGSIVITDTFHKAKKEIPSAGAESLMRLSHNSDKEWQVTSNSIRQQEAYTYKHEVRIQPKGKPCITLIQHIDSREELGKTVQKLVLAPRKTTGYVEGASYLIEPELQALVPKLHDTIKQVENGKETAKFEVSLGGQFSCVVSRNTAN